MLNVFIQFPSSLRPVAQVLDFEPLGYRCTFFEQRSISLCVLNPGNHILHERDSKIDFKN